MNAPLERTMKSNLFALTLLVSLAAFAPACSSGSADDDSTPPLSAKAQMLVGVWNLNNSESRFGTEPWMTADDVDCRIDNTEEFEADGSWTLYDGTNPCGSGLTILTGRWRLAAGDSKILFSYDDVSGEYEQDIELLTELSLVRTFATGLTNGKQTRNSYDKQP